MRFGCLKYSLHYKVKPSLRVPFSCSLWPMLSAASLVWSGASMGEKRAHAATSIPAAQTTAPTVEHLSVTGRLNQERAQLFPALGAVSYQADQRQIRATPQGENAPLSQVLLRLPGVVQDSYGEVHVRGEHGGLTYRVNGVLLPEGLNGFGQELDSRIIQSVSLLTGTLPAQFGFRTAGIVDVHTKTGESLKGNQLSVYGGQYSSVVPSLQLGGKRGRFEYFSTFSYTHTAIGIENPTPSFRPLHDQTEQYKGFTYASWQIDDHSRLSVIGSVSDAAFELPNTPGLPQLYTLDGVHAHDSALQSRFLNDRQHEQNYYAVVSYQRHQGAFDMQLSPYVRYGAIHYTPDRERDLIFQGVAQKEMNDFTTAGAQFDSSWRGWRYHTVRFGMIGHYTAERLNTDSDVFPVDESGQQTSTQAQHLVDRTRNWAVEAGIYLQDEYALTRTLTLNYGARYDRFEASFTHEGQVSPRVNMVWRPHRRVGFHIGYSRFFAPPSPQYIHPSTLARFAGTTNAPASPGGDPTRVERSHYIDAGVMVHVTPHWQVTVDAFSKWSRNMTDLGQFGRAVILVPFSYRRGHLYGGEASTSWRKGPWSLYGSFSYVMTRGQTVNSAQYQFEPEELAYIHTHGIQLDHQGKYTASMGASWRHRHHMAYVDCVYGNGLRSGFANLMKEPQYAIFNIGYEYTLTHLPLGHVLRTRIDVVNLFDKRYQMRDGSGVGVYQAQYGQRRGIYGTTTLEF